MELCGHELALYRDARSRAGRRRPIHSLTVLDSTATECSRRGADTGQRVQCPTCSGRVELKVFACEVHGQCTIARQAPGIRMCRGCRDRQAPVQQNCQGCPDLYQRPGGTLCGRDLFQIDPARTSEAAAIETFRRRLGGELPPCDRWGDDPLPSLPAGSWITAARAASDAVRLSGRLPVDVDAIVGVARGGLWVASLIGELLNLPVYALCQTTGRLTDPGHGGRSGTARPESVRHAALIDDTAYHGSAMRSARRNLQGHMPRATITSAVLYATTWAVAARLPWDSGRPLLDLFGAVSNGHMVEWSLLYNSNLVRMCATDLDGIICPDCGPGEDDDGPRYARWMEQSTPLVRSREHPIPVIVTGRLEKYRGATEAWLSRHGIRYGKLVMWPGGVQERWPNDACAKWKAGVIRPMSGVRVYVESDPRQARVIADHSGKWVVCPELGRTLLPQPVMR